jgi:hypothetical protein
MILANLLLLGIVAANRKPLRSYPTKENTANVDPCVGEYNFGQIALFRCFAVSTARHREVDRCSSPLP